MSKVIDIKNKGNVLRVYFGADNCFDYYGDDWDDIPYEHNSSTVNDEFVTEYMDIYLPYDYEVYSACHKYLNSPWCRNDFKTGTLAVYSIYKIDSKTYNETHVLDLFFETSKSTLLNQLVNNGIRYELHERTE